MAEEISLSKVTFKKVNTVGELKKALQLLEDSEPVRMYSDEEGNQVNKVLCLELHQDSVTFVPWENFSIEIDKVEAEADADALAAERRDNSE